MDYAEIVAIEMETKGNGIELDSTPKEASETGSPSQQAQQPGQEHSEDKDLGRDTENAAPGDKFYGSIRTSKDGKNQKLTDTWTVESNDRKVMEVSNSKGEKYKTNPRTVEKINPKDKLEELRVKQEKARKEAERKAELEKDKKAFEAKQFSYQSLQPKEQLSTLIDAGMQNLWMVGPAGSGNIVTL